MPVVSKRSVFCDGFVAAGKELLLEAVINQTGGAKVTTMRQLVSHQLLTE